MDPKAPLRGLKKACVFVGSRLVTGMLIAAPIYLAALLLLRIAKTLSPIVRPLARLVPAWFPMVRVTSLVLVLLICFLIGLTAAIPKGGRAWDRIQSWLCHRVPGYALIRGFTQRLGGTSEGQAWKPALAEIEEALVPAFIIEELEDGSFTVFVPSVPTPLSGSIYILGPDRVHPLDVSITHVIRAVSQWGLGTKDLAAAMERTPIPSADVTRDEERKVA
jgi:uncharacterized membrane protein